MARLKDRVLVDLRWVQSPFVHRASKYLVEDCTYSHNKSTLQNTKYRNDAAKAACEHVFWNNCMRTLHPNFVVATQPDLTSVYHDLLVIDDPHSAEANITSVPSR